MSLRRTARAGFTLIEILVVIAIIAVLASVVFVALDPATRLADARDARRISDTQTILTAVHQYIVDNGGTAPTGLTTSELQLGTAASGCEVATGGCGVTTAGCLDLSTELASYLASIPVDPQGSAAETNYSIVQDSNGIVTVRACGAENTTISVSR